MYTRFLKERGDIIEKILDVKEDEEIRWRGKGRKRVMVTVTIPKWLAKWKGYDESENTWEPRASLDEESSEEYYLAPSFRAFMAGLTFFHSCHFF